MIVISPCGGQEPVPPPHNHSNIVDVQKSFLLDPHTFLDNTQVLSEIICAVEALAYTKHCRECSGKFYSAYKEFQTEDGSTFRCYSNTDCFISTTQDSYFETSYLDMVREDLFLLDSKFSLIAEKYMWQAPGPLTHCHLHILSALLEQTELGTLLSPLGIGNAASWSRPHWRHARTRETPHLSHASTGLRTPHVYSRPHWRCAHYTRGPRYTRITEQSNRLRTGTSGQCCGAQYPTPIVHMHLCLVVFSCVYIVFVF